MRKTFRVATLSAALFLASCTTIATHFPGVYAIDVDQGNIIDQDMIDQLRPEMNKRQVLYVLGTPLLIDPFHKERWDYLYSVQPGSEDRMQKRITLFFQDDKLMGVQGDFRPTNLPVVAPSKDETVDVPKREIEKTFFQKIAGLFGAGTPEEKVETEAAEEAEADEEKMETEISTENIETEASDNTDTVIDEEAAEQSDAEQLDEEIPTEIIETETSDETESMIDEEASEKSGADEEQLETEISTEIIETDTSEDTEPLIEETPLEIETETPVEEEMNESKKRISNNS